VAAEVGLALLLVVAATAMSRSMSSLLGIHPGFEGSGVLSAEIDLPRRSYPGPEHQLAYVGAALERIRALPGVQAAGAVFPMPMVGAVAPSAFVIEGKPAAAAGPARETPFWLASPGYFASMGIPLLGGRAFREADATGAPGVAMVNRSFARRFFPGEDPIGRRVAFAREAAEVPEADWLRIVGVVGDVHHARLTDAPGPQLYLSFLQSPFAAASVTVRTAGEPAGLAADVRRTLHRLDPELALAEVRPVSEIVGATLGRRRFSAALSSLFAAVGACLAGFGIFGVLSTLVTQRRREIGVRAALGASRADLMRLAICQGLAPAVAGMAAGVFAATALGGLLESQLYEVSASDPALLGGTALLVFAVAFVATLLPAWRAANVDPTAVLRCD
jgi:predicted permease